jgi:hypothetical protein
MTDGFTEVLLVGEGRKRNEPRVGPLPLASLYGERQASGLRERGRL